MITRHLKLKHVSILYWLFLEDKLDPPDFHIVHSVTAQSLIVFFVLFEQNLIEEIANYSYLYVLVLCGRLM